MKVPSPTSSLGKYEGFSQPVYDSYTLHDIYVPLKDGTRLAVSCYVPLKTDSKFPEQFPVLAFYTPYGRFIKTYDSHTGKTANIPGQPIDLVHYGYVYAFIEVRGTGASFGIRKVVNSRQEAEDGAEILEWLAKQPFCDGSVGTYGMSYNGQTQLELISMQPPHLKAAFIGCTDYNKYDGWIRNGIPRRYGSAPDIAWGNTPAENQAAIRKEIQRNVPVADDADGSLLEAAIRQHMANGCQTAMLDELIYRNSFSPYITEEPIYQHLSASTYKEAINHSNVAVYLTGGHYDVFRRDTFIMYHNLNLSKKLTFGTWYHTEEKQDPDWIVEMHRWFDYWLKGIPNGVAEEKPIAIKEAYYNFETDSNQGEGTGKYRYENIWNIQSGKNLIYYLSDGKNKKPGTLTTSPQDLNSTINFHAIYGISSSIESKITSAEGISGIDQKGLRFLSPCLPADRKVIGHAMFYLDFTLLNQGDFGEKCDIDFFVMLSDFDPETQRSFLVTEGHLRTSMRRESADCPYDFLGLPWHPCCLEDTLLPKPGERIGLKIDLLPTAYIFKAGHQIQLTITNSLERMNYWGRDKYLSKPDLIPPLLQLHLGTETRIILPEIYSC